MAHAQKAFELCITNLTPIIQNAHFEILYGKLLYGFQNDIQMESKF